MYPILSAIYFCMWKFGPKKIIMYVITKVIKKINECERTETWLKT